MGSEVYALTRLTHRHNQTSELVLTGMAIRFYLFLATKLTTVNVNGWSMMDNKTINTGSKSMALLESPRKEAEVPEWIEKLL